MAQTTVTHGSFLRGELPPVCVLTGQPADRYAHWTFHPVGRWTWILLPLGVIPWVLARLFAARLDGVLPSSVDAERSLAVLRRVRDMSGLIALVLVGIGIATFTMTLVWAGLVAAAVCLMVMIVAVRRSPFAREVEHGIVLLQNVHPAFVSAVDAARATIPPAPPQAGEVTG